jgi:60 kDa SS-A/Ro ribonucleoprotein
MTSSYSTILKSAKALATCKSTGQRVPRTGHEDIMTKNSSGGCTYTVSDEELIDRILILGTNSNTYYSSANKLTADAITAVKRMVAEGKGAMVVDRVRDIYESGSAPKQDPTFFVLALLTQGTMPVDVRKNALQIVSKIRTLSQLYTWEGMRKQIGDGKKGFGRAVRSALLILVQNHTGLQLAYQSTKYRSRKFGTESWSINDIISCAHIPSKVLSKDSRLVIVYLIKGMEKAEATLSAECVTDENCIKVMNYLRAVEAVKSSTCTTDTAVQLIRQYKLPREVLSTHLLSHIDVWHSLLLTASVGEDGKIVRRITMPITALIRNLGVMASRGLFDDESVAKLVADHLNNPYVLKRGRVHPVAILVAKLTFDAGKGLKGKLSWTVNNTISEGLESAFYVAFGSVDGTGKRILHSVDCSGSMTCATCAVPYLTACQAVSTLVMEAVRRETRYFEAKKKHVDPSDQQMVTSYVQDVMLFNRAGTFVTVTAEHKLNDVMKLVQDCNFDRTDCAQPMIRALDKFKTSGGKSGLYDLFIIYTDNETYYGNVHPSEALDMYNKTTGLNARMVVVATTPTSSSIGYRGHKSILDADPRNSVTPLALNIVGFDLNAPTLIKNFVCGHLSTTTISDPISSTTSDSLDTEDPDCGFEMIDADE